MDTGTHISNLQDSVLARNYKKDLRRQNKWQNTMQMCQVRHRNLVFLLQQSPNFDAVDTSEVDKGLEMVIVVVGCRRGV